MIARRGSKNLSKSKRVELNKSIRHKITNAKKSWIDEKLDHNENHGRKFFQVTKSILKPQGFVNVDELDHNQTAKHFADIASNKWGMENSIDMGDKPNITS